LISIMDGSSYKAHKVILYDIEYFGNLMETVSEKGVGGGNSPSRDEKEVYEIPLPFSGYSIDVLLNLIYNEEYECDNSNTHDVLKLCDFVGYKSMKFIKS